VKIGGYLRGVKYNFSFILFIFYCLCVHFFFFFLKNFLKKKVYLVFFFSFLCLMHLECPLCAHVSSIDLIPCVLKSFQYA
jgi:hypothetical protein